MRISSVTVYGYGNGVLILDTGDDNHMSIKLTDDDNQRLLSLAETIADEHRAALVKQMQTPFVALADFSEIEEAPQF